MENKKVIVICGPTAVGKSDIAVLVAKKLNAEIISADSTQVYKGFDIGSGKITETEKQGVAHHMLDILNFDEEFNVALYKNMVEDLIKQIHSKNKNVIVCGGTGLYIKALVQGFRFFEVEKNESLRQELEQIYTLQGNRTLYEKLLQLDAVVAENIDKNNKVRLIRAIEIASAQNKKIASEKPKFEYEIFVLNSDRAKLYERINNRVEKMFKEGLIQEVSNLEKKGANLLHSSFKSIGYKELYDYVKNNQGNLEEIKETIKQNSRKYAKRQLTWFRSVNPAKWINVESKEASANEIIESLVKLGY